MIPGHYVPDIIPPLNGADYFAIGFLLGVKDELEFEAWDVAEMPDGHSKAWHGAFILFNAIEYIRAGIVPVNPHYKPIFTRL